MRLVVGGIAFEGGCAARRVEGCLHRPDNRCWLYRSARGALDLNTEVEPRGLCDVALGGSVVCSAMAAPSRSIL